MTELRNSYWNGDKEAPEIGVDWGKTDNIYVNALSAAKNIYYEFLNNGGWNFNEDGKISSYFTDYIDDIRKADIGSILGNINLSNSYRRLYNDLDKQEGNYYTHLDGFLDAVIERVLSEDLTMTVITIYFDYKNELISKEPHEGFSTCTFGEASEAEDWFNHRVNVLKFKVV